MDVVRPLTGEVKLHLWNGNQTFQGWDRNSLEIKTEDHEVQDCEWKKLNNLLKPWQATTSSIKTLKMSLHKIKKNVHFRAWERSAFRNSFVHLPKSLSISYSLWNTQSFLGSRSQQIPSLCFQGLFFSPLEYKFWTISLSSCTSVTDDISLNYFRNAFMESVVWDIEAPSFLCYILSDIINRVQSMKDWLCNWEKPSTSQPRHSVMHLHCAHNPLCISLECLFYVEDRKLLLIPDEGPATAAQVTKAYTFWSHRSHSFFSLRTQPRPFAAADPMLLMPYTVVMLLADLVTSSEKWWFSAKWSWCKRRVLAMWVLTLLVSGCTGWLRFGLLLGTDPSMVCLPCVPCFLGKGGGHGTFCEIPRCRQASNMG